MSFKPNEDLFSDVAEAKSRFRDVYFSSNARIVANSWSIDLDGFCNLRYGRDTGFNGKVALIGCQGVSGYGSVIEKELYSTGPKVQKFLGDHASTKGEADIILLAGDNIYDDGPTAEDVMDSHNLSKSRFQKAFRDIYTKPCFPVLGNHDVNIHGGAIGAAGWSFTSLARHAGMSSKKMDMFRTPDQIAVKTMERALRSVYYTYLERSHEGAHRYTHNWHMPWRYYRLVSYEQNIVFYCLDSNCLPFDEPQQAWLKHYYNEDKDFRKILVMHHPIVSSGKRFNSEKDSKIYAKAYNNPATPAAGEMGQWCANTLKSLGCNDFKYLLCAHDHCMVIEKMSGITETSLETLNKDMIQIISGGGGAPLSLTDKGMEEAGKSGRFSHDEAAFRRAASGRLREGIPVDDKFETDTFKFAFSHGYFGLDFDHKRKTSIPVVTRYTCGLTEFKSEEIVMKA